MTTKRPFSRFPIFSFSHLLILFLPGWIPSVAVGQISYTDVTVEAGLSTNFFDEAPGIFVDYNSDGLLDLFKPYSVLAPSGESFPFLYRNNGDGTFTDVATSVNLTNSANWAAFGDYDNDGIKDLYLWDRRTFLNLLYRQERERGFQQVMGQIESPVGWIHLYTPADNCTCDP